MRDGGILAHTAPADIMRRTACADLESAFVSLVRNDHPSNRPAPHYPTDPHRRVANYDSSQDYCLSYHSSPNYSRLTPEATS